MSIYSTLWILKFPKFGEYHQACDWTEVIAQGVPPHIGSPSPGLGYERDDPFGDFLPPAVEVSPKGEAEYMRAVVFVTQHTRKGTHRSGQEYVDPLLTLSGKEYASLPSINCIRESATHYEAAGREWYSSLSILMEQSPSTLRTEHFGPQ